MKISYRHWIKFRGQTLGLVWQTEDGTEELEQDTDGVLLDNGRIVVARISEEFDAIAHLHGLALEEDNGSVQNVDNLELLLDLPASDETCAQILDAWNLFNDIARSVGASLISPTPALDRCYDKLFFGNNLESITPTGEIYRPSFSNEDRRLITEVLNRGRTILAAHLHAQEPGSTSPVS